MAGAITAAPSYQAVSRVSNASVEELRAAGNVYPDWIRTNYLRLPDNIPQRVLDLAIDLTAAEATPYDRAEAIQDYLRQFPYSLDVPAPPIDRDVADFFLFDLQRGYCDYYATTMVILARAAGLPARLVIGYASGSYDSLTAEYTVREEDSHAWVEIYFPSYGWIEFEPTSGQPVVARPGEKPAEPAEDVQAQVESLPNRWVNLGRWALFGAESLLGLSAAILVLIWGKEIWTFHRLAPAEAIARIYRRYFKEGYQLVETIEMGATPHEFNQAVSQILSGLPSNLVSGRLLSAASGEGKNLTDLYAQAVYSPHPPSNKDKQHALHLWQRLRWRLILARMYKQLPVFHRQIS